MKKILSLLFTLVWILALFVGCGKDADGKSTEGISSAPSADANFWQTDADMFTQRDCTVEFDENKAVVIKLNGDSATASSDSVKISGSQVTITEEATYVISGELTDGMLIVHARDTAKLQLVFKGVNITSKASAALYIEEADKVFVTLADGTSNSLTNGGSFAAVGDSNIDGALCSKQDLTLNGSGSLTVTSPAGHGIVCKDDLVIASGSYVVNSAFHGLNANDSIRIANAHVTINAGKDGIHAENNEDTSKGFVYISKGALKIEAEGDGIYAGAYMQIAGGAFDLLAGGGSKNGKKESSDHFGEFMGGGKPGGKWPNGTQGEDSTSEEDSISMKGLKAAGGLMISGGDFTVNSADDCIHADASVMIYSGTFALASGDDAIHAEDTLTIAAGTIEVSESYEGLEALHIDIKGGDIGIKATDDGLNAAGGADQSGTQGGRDGMFGGPAGMGGGRPGGGPGGMSSNSNGSIHISGGTLYINASGDGIDANGTLEITGGHTTVVGPTRGDTATLDYDKSATISGGTFIGTGASGMAQSFSDSTQGIVAVRVGNQPAATEISLKDSTGNTLISYQPELDFAVIILSSPDIEKGKTYTITVGTQSGEITAN